MTAVLVAPPAVIHIIRPEPDGSIGGADLHVLELAAAQADLALAKPQVFAPGHGRDFARYAADLGVAVVSRPQRRTDGRGTVVHSHGYEADLVALILAAARSRGGRRPPVVMSCHGIIQPDLRHRLLNAVDRACLRRADVLIGVSEDAVRRLRRIAPSRPVHLVRNGVRAPRHVPDQVVAEVRSQLGAEDAAPIVGFVGRLSREKRPDLFLAVSDLVAARHATARFAVVGGGALAAEIGKATARSAAGSRTVLAGLRHDMDAVFAALDVLVVPSDVENTPRVVLEALARGVPVVVTSAGDMPLMVRDFPHAAVAARGDARRLARLVLDLLGARAARDGDGVATRSAPTAEDMARAVHHVYVSSIGRSTSAGGAGVRDRDP